jgi:hypothetical protein
VSEENGADGDSIEVGEGAAFTLRDGKNYKILIHADGKTSFTGVVRQTATTISIEVTGAE